MTTANRLRRFKMDKYADVQDALTDAVSGQDLYERKCKCMSHGKTDHHAATVFKLPVNEVRRKRKSLRYRFFSWLGSYG